MRMRKLFASIATVATMLGGMTMAATSAQGDDVDTGIIPIEEVAPNTPLLQVNNAQEGHTYTPYKFAELTLNADGKSLNVSTVDAWKDVVADAADVADGDKTMPSEYEGNPAAYVATFTPERLRKFAETLTTLVQDEYAELLASPDGVALNVAPEDSGTTQKIGVNGEGWYFVTDLLGSQFGTSAVVATTINGLTGDFKVNGDAGTGQGNITVTGQFNAKNGNPDKPTKTVNGGADGDVSIGDTLNYTITHKIPAGAGTYTMIDTADKGLTIDTSSIKVVVKGAGENGKDVTLQKDKDYTLTSVENSEGKTVTTITLAENLVPKYAGKTIEVTYTAMVNKDILENDDYAASNTIKVPGGTDESTVKTHTLLFHKINKKHQDVAGAKFVVKDINKGRTGFLKLNEDGTWARVQDQDDATVFTSNELGKVVLQGLGAGDYEVIETAAPNGYDSNFLAHFTLTLGEDGMITLKDGAENAHGLASGSGVIEVLNVKSASELPETGAAGTVLFTVVGLLLAVAAVTVFARSRMTKRQLMA